MSPATQTTASYSSILANIQLRQLCAAITLTWTCLCSLKPRLPGEAPPPSKPCFITICDKQGRWQPCMNCFFYLRRLHGWAGILDLCWLLVVAREGLRSRKAKSCSRSLLCLSLACVRLAAVSSFCYQPWLGGTQRRLPLQEDI